MSKQELWKDPITGRHKPFKVGGVKVHPSFRDDELFNVPAPLRDVPEGAVGRDDSFWRDTSNHAFIDELAADPLPTRTTSEWDAYIRQAATPAPTEPGRRDAPVRPVRTRTAQRSDSRINTRRGANAGLGQVQQGNEERESRIARLMRSLQIES